MVSDEQGIAKKFPFMEDGGEMGRLTREFDWGASPLGAIETWPAALRTSVSILLHSGFPMLLWWGDDMIQFYNDAFRPSLGQDGKHPKALGQKAIESWAEVWGTQGPLIESIKKTRKSIFAEDQLIPIYRNGKIEDVYWTYSYSAIIGEQGNVDGIFIVATDTTEKVNNLIEIKKAQEILAFNEANFRNIILQAPIAMCIMLGPEHVVDVANDLIIELWGKPAEQVLNKPIFEGLPDARGQGLEKLLHDVYHTGVPFTADEMAVKLVRSGRSETIYQNFVYEPYRDSDGTILGVLAITIDVTTQVTARLKIEEIVKERTESLRQSNAELTQFAYITSHDLQEPARKISTFIDMLESTLGNDVSEKSKFYLSKINSASQRMLTLIRDILAISQLSKASVVYEQIDLNKTLVEILKDFELLIEQKRCVVKNQTLPTIEAIPVQMNQLFSNLISNAIKFAREGTKLALDIKCRVADGSLRSEFPNLKPSSKYYVISFADNGIGFNQSYAEQIFNIFQRLHSRQEYAGTGMGLAMCKKIAENHGGHIYAKSSLGEGAMFTVILPERQEDK